jgi:quercetin dioxygenase-like cupin family protein
MKITIVTLLAAVALVSTAISRAQDNTNNGQDKEAAAAKAVQTWSAHNIVWQREDPDGTKWAVLEGDKDAPGKLFTYAFFLPAHYWEHHWHTQDARVAVIRGALKVAQGDKLDKKGAITYPAGSYLMVPAYVQHTMGADVDTIIIGTAVGPWKTHRHDEEEVGDHEHHH